MKVFLLAPKEAWVVDRFCIEWYADNPDITVGNPYKADVVWLIADWAFDQLSYELLKSKKVLTSVHHIVPEKFGAAELELFRVRDAITNAYHVPCQKTKKQVEDILAQLGSVKPIFVRPFWINEALWSPSSKSDARVELKLDADAFFVGSFQRDTEGKDLVTPKLEKGPDRFCDAIELMHKEGMQPVPLLAGWRRQYVTNRLDIAKIAYVYKELPGFPLLKKLYTCLDLYVVGSRYEGGPQAIFECAAMDVPIVSTDCGAATEILHPGAIFNPDVPESLLDAMIVARSPEARDHARNEVTKHFRLPAYTFFRSVLNNQ